ncbi:MAG: hypothetical protein GXP54_13720 [Deltaproteobacteria bacterium]|nr:hypothetical protein [Deltaproteobacteria bacterium]
MRDFFVYLSSKGFGKSLYYHAPVYLASMMAVALILGRSAGAWWRSGGKGDRANDGRVKSRKAKNRKAKQGLSRHSFSWYSPLTPTDLLSGTPEGLLKLTALISVLFLCEYAALNEFYDFYAVPLMAFMAVPAAFFMLRVYSAARDAATLKGLVLPIVLIGAFSLHGAWARHLNQVLWPRESSAANAGKVVEYDWRKPDVPAALAGLSRFLFFSDRRVKGEVTPYYRHYVWNKRLTFSEVYRIADYVRGHTKPEETITGASTIAPLVALVAGRRMAGDEADTNSKRFKAGVLTERDFFNEVCADKVRYIVSAPRSKFTRRFMEANSFIRANFKRDQQFMDMKLNHFRGYPITLYRRIDREGLPGGMVCEYQ